MSVFFLFLSFLNDPPLRWAHQFPSPRNVESMFNQKQYTKRQTGQTNYFKTQKRQCKLMQIHSYVDIFDSNFLSEIKSHVHLLLGLQIRAGLSNHKTHRNIYS